MPKWEYRVVPFPDEGSIEEHLNKAGQDGWELVSVFADPDDDEPTFVLKRQIAT